MTSLGASLLFWILIKVTNVITEHKKGPKGANRAKRPFFPKEQKKPSPKELKVGLDSGPDSFYLYDRVTIRILRCLRLFENFAILSVEFHRTQTDQQGIIPCYSSKIAIVQILLQCLSAKV